MFIVFFLVLKFILYYLKNEKPLPQPTAQG